MIIVVHLVVKISSKLPEHLRRLREIIIVTWNYFDHPVYVQVQYNNDDDNDEGDDNNDDDDNNK